MEIRISDELNDIIRYARDEAMRTGSYGIGPDHLFLGVLRHGDNAAFRTVTGLGIDADNFKRFIDSHIFTNEPIPYAESDKISFTRYAQNVLSITVLEASKQGVTEANSLHLLLALCRTTENYGQAYLRQHGVDYGRLLSYMRDEGMLGKDPEQEDDKSEDDQQETNQESKPEKSVIEDFGFDLTKAAAEGKLDPVVGRETEIARVIEILGRRKKNNPMLIGEPGVGKSAIVEGIALRIAGGSISPALAKKRLISLDIALVVAGTKYRGDFEKRLKSIIKEASSNPDIILFIDEFHTIVGAGGAQGSLDAANILKPSLARGELQIIGATTIEEYRKHIEKDAALERRFQPVMVEEPSEEEAVEILIGLKGAYENHHHVTITDEALEAAVHLSARYINDRFLPDKAIDLIDEACSKVRLSSYTSSPKVKELEKKVAELEEEKEQAIKDEAYERASEIKKMQKELNDEMIRLNSEWEKVRSSEQLIVGENEVADIVASWTKIPVRKLEEEESERLRKLESILHERVIGQEEAVSAVAKAIRRGRVGLKDPKRPIGSFLFLGPTGVGKTELSKALAEAMFGKEDAMIRVDMSEYMEKHSVSKLIGSPPGYVGYDEGGQLSEKIRRNPYSVLLFDEIEKAHPDIFNILLQVLDDGHITDSQGRKIDFKNTVIIMTSNAGAANIVTPKKLGFSVGDTHEADYQKMKAGVMDEVKHLFKPEFLNRIDETIVFHPLTKENVKDIADIMLKTISKRIKEQLGIETVVSEAVRDHLAEKGFDENYGARPLRRVIQNEIEDAMAEEYLDGKFVQGDTVALEMNENHIKFVRK